MTGVYTMPQRYIFPALVTRPGKTKEGKYAYQAKSNNADCGCSVTSWRKMRPFHVNVLLGALSCGRENGVSDFKADDFLRVMGMHPDRANRENVGRMIDAALDWFADATVKTRERVKGGTAARQSTFQIINKWERPTPGVYEWRIEWNLDFLRYLGEAWANVKAPVRLGVAKGLRATPCANAVAYWTHAILSDTSKTKCRGVFRLDTFLSRFGYLPPERDAAHFSRSIAELDSILRGQWEHVEWALDGVPATVREVNARNWRDASVKIY